MRRLRKGGPEGPPLRGYSPRAESETQEKLALRARLEEAQRTAANAREYLMATEAKLDLIEAAIQVLDARTRETSLNRS